MSTVTSSTNTHSTNTQTTPLVATTISPPKKKNEPKSKYEPGEKLGEGIVSIVHKVKGVAGGSPLAMKRNLSRDDSYFMAREYSTLRDLEKSKTRHTIRARDFVWHNDGTHTIVMDCLLSGSLNQMIQKSPFALEQIITIGCQALEYLEDLRFHDVVHSDLKPSNMSFDPDSNCLRVYDYSLSSRIGRQVSHSMIQTPPYRDPDVILGVSRDCRVDTWSLGCILYELCTDRQLFSIANLNDEVEIGTILLHQMVEQLGMPSRLYLLSSPRFADFFKIVDKNICFKQAPVKPICKDNFREIMLESGKTRGYPSDKVEALTKLIESMLAYENRPHPCQLLKNPLFKDEVCFKIGVKGKKATVNDKICISHCPNEPANASIKEIFNTSLSSLAMCSCFHLPTVGSGQLFISFNGNYNLPIEKPKNRQTIILELLSQEGKESKKEEPVKEQKT